MGLFDFLKKGDKQQDSAATPADGSMPMGTDVSAPNTNTAEAAAPAVTMPADSSAPATSADPTQPASAPEATTGSDVQPDTAAPAAPTMPAADGSAPASDGSSSDSQTPAV